MEMHYFIITLSAGASGVALSFCDREERTYLKDIVRLTTQHIPVVEEHPYQPVPVHTAERNGFRPAVNRNNSSNNSYNQKRGSYKKRRGPLVNI